MSTIAYVVKMYPRFSETFIVNEILELERQGVDVRVYSLMKPNDGRFHAKLADVTARVVYIPRYPQMELERVQADHALVRERFRDGYAAAHAYALKRNQDATTKRFLQAGCVAADLLRHPVHAMHAHFASSAVRVSNLVQLMIGVPYSFTAHAKDIYHQRVTPRSLQNKIGGARFVATVSQVNKTYMEEQIGDTPSDIRVLYNGVDLEQFKPIKPNDQIVRRKNHIMTVGRLVEKKGFNDLISACAVLKKRGVTFTCDIIGKGGLEKALRAQIVEDDVADCVQLVGAKPQEQVLTAYHQASLFALPCVIGKDGNRDGLPTVLLEAMATGLPVVTTTVTGNVEIVDDGVNGLLVPPHDVAALADALELLLRDDAVRKRMGTAARATAEQKFDVRQNVAQLADWLCEPHSIETETETQTGTETTAGSYELADLPQDPVLTLGEVLQTV